MANGAKGSGRKRPATTKSKQPAAAKAAPDLQQLKADYENKVAEIARLAAELEQLDVKLQAAARATPAAPAPGPTAGATPTGRGRLAPLSGAPLGFAAPKAGQPPAATPISPVAEAQLRSAAVALASVGTLRSAEKADPLRFDEFLGSVSQAMVQAQQHLDRQSEAYISSSSNPAPLPTFFRLPRVKGSAKFSVAKGQTEKLGLFVFSSSETSESQQQHAVEFEFVAVPPPPESGIVPGAFVPGMPRIELLLSAPQRANFLRLALQHPAVQQALTLPGLPAVGPDASSDVALWVLQRPGSPAGTAATLLLGRAGSGNARLALVSATLPDAATTPPTAGVVHGVDPLPLAATQAAVAAFITGIVAAQAQLRVSG